LRVLRTAVSVETPAAKPAKQHSRWMLQLEARGLK
jgi:hypothetical protein